MCYNICSWAELITSEELDLLDVLHPKSHRGDNLIETWLRLTTMTYMISRIDWYEKKHVVEMNEAPEVTLLMFEAYSREV